MGNMEIHIVSEILQKIFFAGFLLVFMDLGLKRVTKISHYFPISFLTTASLDLWVQIIAVYNCNY